MILTIIYKYIRILKKNFFHLTILNLPDLEMTSDIMTTGLMCGARGAWRDVTAATCTGQWTLHDFKRKSLHQKTVNRIFLEKLQRIV